MIVSTIMRLSNKSTQIVKVYKLIELSWIKNEHKNSKQFPLVCPITNTHTFSKVVTSI